MKKTMLKILVGCFVLVCISLMPFIVKAADDDGPSAIPDTTVQIKCAASSATKKCATKDGSTKLVDAYYGVDIIYNDESDARDNILRITTKKGTFTATFNSKVPYGGNDIAAGTPITFSSASPLEIDFTGKNSVDLKIVITLTGVTADEAKEEYCAANCYVITAEMEIDVPDTNASVENENYGGVCKSFRESVQALPAGSEERAFYESEVDYCFKTMVPANYKESTVTLMIQGAKDVWTLESMSDMVADFPVIDKNKLFFENEGETVPRKLSNLQCAAFADTNSNQYFTLQTNKINDVCEVSCMEEFVVTYDPPSAVKAGLCFQYTVTVRSKLTCKTVTTKNKPKRKTLCTPYAKCHAKKKIHITDQGGPDDNFDDCILECDGGDYSQVCINKCYNKVYGNSTQKTALLYGEEESLAYKIASSNADITKQDSYRKEDESRKDDKNKKCGIRSSMNVNNWEAIYKELNKNAGGHYKYDNDKDVVWVNDTGCYWDNLGGYYFQNKEKAKQTIWTLLGTTYTFPDGTVQVGTRADGSKKYRIIASYKKVPGCGANCKWNGCASNSTTGVNAEQIEEDYQKALTDYKNKLAQCKKYELCNEKTATFEMSVTTSKGTERFGPVTNQSSKTNGDLQSDPIGMIESQSGICFGNKVTGDSESWHYKTVINFPGTWINYKTGEIKYTKQTGTEYKEEKNVFCTALDEKPVNVKWWVWKITEEAAPATGGSRYNEIINDTNNNITAKIINFGRYNWTVEIGCFYALYNNSPPVNTSYCAEGICGDSCTDGKCLKEDDPGTSTAIPNYQFRIIKPTDLFPSNNGTNTEGTTVASANNVGFNWTPAAGNIINRAYKVEPEALIASIQLAGDKIYNEANEKTYLDYEIILDEETIRTIRGNYSKKSYAVYGEGDNSGDNPGKFERINGVTTYRSGLLNSLGGNVHKRGVIGCNNEIADECPE